MKVPIVHHAALFKAKSMGDIMLDIMKSEQNFMLPFDKWTDKAYEVAKQQVNFKAKSSREMLPVYFRQAFVVIMYREFQDRYSMTICGKRMAQLENRKNPYIHCTVIHYLNRHKDAMEYPKANSLYIDVFNAIFTELKRQSFLIRFTNANDN